jgi:hypothetical protein
MRKLLVTFFAFALVIPIAIAQEWWNSSWHFRFPVNISSSVNVENASVKINLNFISLLESLKITGTFDSNSIRVIEDSYELPYDWENETYSKGNITWIANGTTLANTNRTFWIYFDVIENGEKTKAEIISERPYWRSGYTNNMNVYSPVWNRSWSKLIEVYWKWSTEASYDIAYLYVDGLQVRQKDGVGSELARFLGSSIQCRFTSDASITNPTTDEYGTYGCAIDWIKFYPVANYTTPSLTIIIGNVSQQNLLNWLELPANGSLIDRGELILIRGYVTDESMNLLSGASVNFTLTNGTVEYTCIATDEGNGYYNCSWDSSNKPLGNYSIRMNSSKQYYNSNSTLWIDRFTLRTGPPIINISLSSPLVEHYSWVQINASINDQSGTGINWTKINITQPNGNIEQFDMINIAPNVWTLNYTNTSQRGVYNIVVYASDNVGRVGESNVSLKVYIKLNVSLKTQQNYYHQDDVGRVEFLLKDSEGNFIQNANITLEIKNPNNNLIWLFNGVTNSNGTLEPMPTFSIASSDLLGNYTLISTTTYFDSLINVSITRRDSFNFIVYEKEVISVSFLTLNLEAPSQVEIGKSLQIFAITTDSLKNVDVDDIKVSLYDPLDNLIVENVSMERVSVGIYSKAYATSSSSTQGNWKWIVTATKGPNAQKKVTFTRLVGGPFDVRNITILDNTIPDLAVMVEIENKGSVGQDVIVEWNLTRIDTGESLASGAETIFIPANSVKQHVVYPTTNYIGNVKITFLVYYSGTEKAGAYSIFTTQPALPAPTLPAMPTAAVVKVGVPKIEIIEWTREIEIERGWIGFLLATVKNTGEVDLSNITISIKGIDPSWVELPEKFDLKVGENKSISIKFAVPINAISGNYEGNITVYSLDAKDEKKFLLRVFASKAELIYYQIQTLKQKLDELTNKTLQSEKEGKDVRIVKEMLDIARDKIALAEKYLDKKMYDDASDTIRIVKNYLDKAEFELQVAQPIVKPPYEAIVETVKKWFLLIILSLTSGIVFIILILMRSKKYYEVKIEIPPSTLKKAIVGQITIQKLEREKEKIEKTLSILEKQYKEGLISKESYEELKTKSEELLSEIERKLKEWQTKE